MIHAPFAGKDVTEAAVYETPTSIRRVVPSEAEAAALRTAQNTNPLDAFTGTGQVNADELSALLAGADNQRLALNMLAGSNS